MFTVYCQRHGARTLIFPSSIDRVENGPEGIRVHYHCTCGERGVYRTGRRQPVAAV